MAFQAGSSWVARVRSSSRQVGRFLEALWGQIVHDRLIIRASGLAYASLLAVVPLLAVVFALFTAFEAFDDLKDRIQDFLLQRFLPAGQEDILGYIDQFAQNSRNLGFVGFVVLIVTAILLLDNIDWNFNEIWHVDRRRSLISRLTAYTSVLVFGTVLIGLSVTLSARLKALLMTGTGLELSFLSRVGSMFFPLASSFLAFLLMFVIIPASRVNLRSAAIGAAFSAITWEAGKSLFAASIGTSVRYSTIYGSLAAIPIFLIWLYVTWVLVLVGLEVAYTHQHYAALTRRGTDEEPRGRDRLALAVKVFAAVADRFDLGSRPPTSDELADRFGVAESAVQEMVDVLLQRDLLRCAVDGEEEGLVPAVSLDRVCVVDVVRAMFGGVESVPDDGRDCLEIDVDEILAAFESAGREAIADLSFRDLVRRHRREEGDRSESSNQDNES